MILLAIDPSGSFNEGQGTSGWVVMRDDDILAVGQLRAQDYTTRQEYWASHKKLIEKVQPTDVVFEEFRLYKTKAKSQINSEMETSKLLGYIEMICYEKEIVFDTQLARTAKHRWKDNILVHKDYINKTDSGRCFINNVQVSGHIVDALRHALHYRLKHKKTKEKLKC
jgi:hypothetical protein